MKKNLLLLILSLLSLFVQADPVEINDIYYNLNMSIKTAEVAENPNKYSGDIDIPQNITLNNGEVYSVTSIGGEAFRDCSNLTSVTIPNSVTSIGRLAFIYCTGLTSVTIPNGVTSIGSSAFHGCSNLTSVSISESVKTLGSYVFFGCKNLISIIIPNNVTSIGNKAFYGCYSLTSITIPNNVTSIGESAFQNCSGLTSITIGSGIKNIGDNAFWGCTGLTSIYIPNSLTHIGYRAFYGCSNLSAVLISNIEAWCKISFDIFVDTSELPRLYDMSSNPLSLAHHLYVNGEQLTDLIIPDGIAIIKDMAFYGCSDLTSVSFPSNNISIGLDAFGGCTGLSAVHISDLKAWCNSSFSAFRYWQYPEDGDCHITSTNPLYYARHLYLNGEKITNLVIPNGVTSISDFSFYYCSDLTSVSIPSSVTSIGAYAFPMGVTLTFLPIEIVEDENHISFADVNVKALCVANWDTDGNGSLSYEETATVTDLGDVFADNTNITSFDELQYFTGLTAIGDNAFMGCNNLATVTLPESIVSIGAYAFYGCSALTSFTIPQGVSNIGSYAFRGCTGLTDVYCLPQDVPTTASNAFYNSNIGNATLHVLVSSYNSYKNAVPWKNFKNMLGDIPVPCATPVISYVDGELVFTCDTEGVEFNSSITSADMGERKDSRIGLYVAYDITVYATKEGYNPSETVTATLCWVDAEPVNQVATGTLEIAAVPVLVKSRGGVITVEGIGDGTEVKVYSTGGMLVGSATAVDQTATISTSLTPGTVAVVDLGKKAVKVVVR